MRKDLLTGEQFSPKRITQKFASAANRIIYYNNKANQERHKNGFINKPLHRNVRVLDSLMDDVPEKTVHREFMLGKGFNFGILTHYVKFEGERYPSVYQYIIIGDGEDSIRMINSNWRIMV